MIKKLLSILFSVFIFCLYVTPVSAFKRQTYISFVFPVRELDQTTQSTLDFPIAIHQAATASATPVTWLLNLEAISTSSTSSYFKQLPPKTNQVGLLLEITESLLKKTSVGTPQHKQVISYLSSYFPEDRKKLIDQAFKEFYEVFGYYPATVAAPHLDSYSLSYLRSHYSVISSIIAVPSNTDSLPEFPRPLTGFLPSTQNSLVPGQTKQTTIPISVSTYNPPLPYTDFSLEPGSIVLYPNKTLLNDFNQLLLDLSSTGFNEYSSLTLGAPNHTKVSAYLPVFKTLVAHIDDKKGDLDLLPITSSGFGTFLNQRYPSTSPAHLFFFHSKSSLTIIYKNPFYETTFVQDQSDTKLTNLTVFNNQESEAFNRSPNYSQQLSLTNFPLITPSSAISIDFDFSAAKLSASKGEWTLNLKTKDKTLIFTPHSLTTPSPLSLPAHPSISQKDNTTTFNSNWAPYSFEYKIFLINVLKFLGLLLLILSLFGIPPKKLLKLFKKHLFATILIVLLSFIASLTTIKNFTLTPFGLSFWGAHSHDAFFHLAVIESFKQNFFSFANPLMNGSSLQNYHYVFDLITAILSKFLAIQSSDLYFRLLPPLLAILLGSLSYSLLLKLKFSRSQSLLSLPFIYLTGSLGFIVTLLRDKQLFAGESVFWSTQAISFLLNPPFALSLVILLAIFNLLLSQRTLAKDIATVILIALLIQTKAYAAILLVPSLWLIFLISLRYSTPSFTTKRLFLLAFFSSILSLIFFLPTSNLGASSFIFSPLWFIRNLFSATDRLNIEKLSTAWQNYHYSSFGPKLFILQLLGTLLFLVGNFGVRLFSLKELAKISDSIVKRLIIIIAITGTIIPLIFIQSGNTWNSIQFLYYPLFLLTLFLGPALSNLLYSQRNLFQFLGVIFIFCLLALPTTIGTLNNYTSPSPSTFIDSYELRQLEILSRQTKGMVVSPVYTDITARPFPIPRPLFAYDSTAYITALTAQPSYFSDELNLIISGYDYQLPKILNQRLFLTNDHSFQSQFVDDNSINYLYVTPLSKPLNIPQSFSKVFDSTYYTLYTKTK